MVNRTATTSAAALVSLALAFASPVFAQPAQQEDHEAHHPEGQKKPPAAKAAPAKPAAKGPAAMMGSGMNMGTMEAKMKAMREQMEKIRATQDPQERRRLMDEHMQSMQQGMALMRGMTHGGSGGASQPGAKAPSPAMRMEGMEQRMDRMQMMMEQMMAHQRVMQEGMK